MVDISTCIPPVNTTSHGGHIIVHSTRQHNTTWWSDQRVFHPSTQHHMAVTSSSISPVNTTPHGGQINVHSTCQPNTTWRSHHRAFHPSTQHHVAVRSKTCEADKAGLRVECRTLLPSYLWEGACSRSNCDGWNPVANGEVDGNHGV